jgi:hypothetical protein
MNKRNLVILLVWLSVLLMDVDKRIKKRKFTVSLWYALVWEAVAMLWAARVMLFS